MQFSYKFLNIQELIIYELTIQELTIINDLMHLASSIWYQQLSLFFLSGKVKKYKNLFCIVFL